ncbi:Apolipoprotein N-acyltransferase [Pseudoalteromonas luteoviolacea B = ATCC 29581]|nr:Apolipoprotein N-acyltransferase [Pseudoalteromonas luteoviolacea B = ATCC 29581]
MALSFYATEQPNWKTTFKYGWLFGFSWFCAGISWVHVSIAEFGGMPLIASLTLMALLCSYLALYPALAFSVGHIVAHTPTQRVIYSAAAFFVTEWLRGTLLTGFPWLSFGYTQTDSPLNVLAPWIGEVGLTGLIILLSGFCYQLVVHRQWKSLALAVTIVIIGLLVSIRWVTTGYSEQEKRILLVQGNIQQSLKWQPEHFWPTMKMYRDVTRQSWNNVDLVVWPEAAIPEIEENAFPYLDAVGAAAAFNQTAVITGIPDYQFDTRNVFNSLIVLGKYEHTDTANQYQYLGRNRYQKHQLLPIGEFVPFEEWLRPIAPLFNLVMSSFTRGEQFQNNLRANGLNILPAICYEIAFAELVRGNFKSDSDILFTVSNDAWFGDSHGPHQHMQIARMRALELQRPLVRVTNNGLSGVYDPISKNSEMMPQFEQTSLVAKVKLIHGTSWFSRFGQTPVCILALLILTFGISVKLKDRISKRIEVDFF